MAMLDREVTHHMYWSDFKYKYKRDPAFTAVLDNKKKEKLFKEHIKEIERKKERLTELEDDYMDLLRETREINPRSRWRDIKRILEKDDRYHAIRSSHQREDMFRDYLEDLERDRRRRSRTRSRER
jgi:transcription elongation regulator 1